MGPAIRVAAVVIFAGATLIGNPAALQRPEGLPLHVATVNGRPALAGEVLVKFRRQLARYERGQLDQQTDADQNRAIGSAGVRRMHSRRYDTSTLLAVLRSHPDVVYAEPNYIVQADAVPTDSLFGMLWGLRNIGQVVGTGGTPGADIGATLAWDVSTGSAATVVAVVDTGIDYTHLDLAANVWSAPASFTVTIGGQTITCAAGTHGFNAITNTCDPFDDHGHGTHVSGTIGAVGNNHLGVAGVNWTTSIMAAKSLSASGTGTVADAIEGIEFVIQAAAATGANVRVISNSWSIGGESQALLDEINRANASNMLFVVSAGNGGFDNDVAPHYPASYTAPNLIAVASTNNNDNLASDSNRGALSVHLAAPGVNILSTYPGGSYQYLSGTSMAAPHVSGAAALVLSRCALNTSELKANLLGSVDPIPLLAGRVITGGRLNVNTAIRSCVPLVAVPDVVSLTQADATAAIATAGLTVGAMTTASSTTVSAGSIISQTPAAGTQVTTGSAVALVVSSGPPLVAVPDVVSLTQVDATAAIATAGLTVGTTTTASSTTVPAGSIISQNPAGGSQVASGSGVALVVSSGPPLVAVPNVVTLTQAAATAAISSAGLAVGAITTASSTTVPAGSIISQTPAAGTPVTIGSAVALVVSSGAPPVVDVVVEQTLSVDGIGTRSTPSFSTTVPGELLLAFAASDGASAGGQTLTVSGGGLAWTLVQRANTQAGTAEIWRATAATALTNVTVTSTPSQGGYDQSLTVISVIGASGIGASAKESSASGAPSVTLTTTRGGALVFGVGYDWDSAMARTVTAGQTMIHQWMDTRVGDTFWVQTWTGKIDNAGTSVRLADTAPTNDRWNFASVEIVPR